MRNLIFIAGLFFFALGSAANAEENSVEDNLIDIVSACGSWGLVVDEGAFHRDWIVIKPRKGTPNLNLMVIGRKDQPTILVANFTPRREGDPLSSDMWVCMISSVKIVEGTFSYRLSRYDAPEAWQGTPNFIDLERIEMLERVSDRLAEIEGVVEQKVVPKPGQRDRAFSLCKENALVQTLISFPDQPTEVSSNYDGWNVTVIHVAKPLPVHLSKTCENQHQ